MSGAEDVLVIGPVCDPRGFIVLLEWFGVFHSAIQEMITVGHAADDSADQNELLHHLRILQGEIYGEFAAVRTSDQDRFRNFQVPQQRGEIFGFSIPSGGFWGTAVATAVVANGVKGFAERGPNGVEDGGMRQAIVKKDDGLQPGAAFFVVDFPVLNIEKRARYWSRQQSWRLRARRSNDETGEEDGDG